MVKYVYKVMDKSKLNRLFYYMILHRLMDQYSYKIARLGEDMRPFPNLTDCKTLACKCILLDQWETLP